ncbi:LrgB family protein [Marinobacterium rhizophilum]|uniref:LrgB family protein n=1 Tax=Marinobacterium rhizophilum TaxID=420402 RepID=A0ABY5HMS5_9GAMM|nr:LrgB family protein [Marinobacterium rhizophilum]UTW13229.1 LrgB family protein [Marinobacterium rhizophilum]
MRPELEQFWVYLGRDPLAWLLITLSAYVLSRWLYERAGQSVFLNPTALTVCQLVLLLSVTGVTYDEYFAGAQFIHVLLGPAVVCLALPIWQHRRSIRRSLPALIPALLAGSLVSVLSAVGLGWALGLDHSILMTLVPKSATAPVAMGIAQDLGGIPELAAVLCAVTGIVGAIVGVPLMTRLGLRDARAQGLALGITSHGIGTAAAFQVNPVMGVYSSIGMALNAILTAVLAGVALLLWL